MASRISQMRNAIQPQPQPQPMGLSQQAIDDARRMMNMVRAAQDPQAALAQILQNNPNTPAIANMLKSNGNLEAIARQMAQARGINIDQLIGQLQGGN